MKEEMKEEMKVAPPQITVGRISSCEGLIRKSLATLDVFNEVFQQLHVPPTHRLRAR